MTEQGDHGEANCCAYKMNLFECITKLERDEAKKGHKGRGEKKLYLHQ